MGSIALIAASALGPIMAGQEENRAAKFEAAQMEAKGKEELAAAQREAEGERKKATLVQSRQQALAAASGAGAGIEAPTIVRLMTDTAAQGDYNAGALMYGGESRRRGLMDSASSRRASGKASLLGGYLAGFGAAADKAGSMAGKFG